jgi:nicotinamidase/pyrazinamidase
MKALLLVDLQKDFFQGPMGVKSACRIIPIINQLLPLFPLIVASKDWHPKNHISFASSSYPSEHLQKWPEHCLQDSTGAEFPPELHQQYIQKIFYKGNILTQESFSAFYQGDAGQSTGLDEYLHHHQVKDLYIAGLLAEYCVKASAEDGLKKGYRVWLIEDAIASSDPSIKNCCLQQLAKQGAKILQSKNLNV